MSRSHSQLDDVRVSEEFEILDLSADLADDIKCFDLLSIEYLDCDLVTGQLVDSDCRRQNLVL